MIDEVTPRALRAKLQGLTMERVRRSLQYRTLHALGRFEAVRKLAGIGVPRPLVRASSSVFNNADIGQLVDTLRRDGFAPGLELPASIVDEILAWTASAPCFGNRNLKWGFPLKERAAAERRAGKAFTLASYANSASGCSAIRALEADPLIYEVARRYVGPRVRHIGTQVWWSFPTDVSEADRCEYAQMFHFDLDDFRFVKFFFYLTDVNAESGPHVYVRGTHRKKRFRHLYPMRRLSDEDVVEAYGRDRILTIEGNAGSGFAEDTFGIHKGATPTKGARLLLQLEFATLSYGSHSTDIANPKDLGFLVPSPAPRSARLSVA